MKTAVFLVLLAISAASEESLLDGGGELDAALEMGDDVESACLNVTALSCPSVRRNLSTHFLRLLPSKRKSFVTGMPGGVDAEVQRILAAVEKSLAGELEESSLGGLYALLGAKSDAVFDDLSEAFLGALNATLHAWAPVCRDTWESRLQGVKECLKRGFPVSIPTEAQALSSVLCHIASAPLLFTSAVHTILKQNKRDLVAVLEGGDEILRALAVGASCTSNAEVAVAVHDNIAPRLREKGLLSVDYLHAYGNAVSDVLSVWNDSYPLERASWRARERLVTRLLLTDVEHVENNSGEASPDAWRSINAPTMDDPASFPALFPSCDGATTFGNEEITYVVAELSGSPQMMLLAGVAAEITAAPAVLNRLASSQSIATMCSMVEGCSMVGLDAVASWLTGVGRELQELPTTPSSIVAGTERLLDAVVPAIEEAQAAAVRLSAMPRRRKVDIIRRTWKNVMACNITAGALLHERLLAIDPRAAATLSGNSTTSDWLTGKILWALAYGVEHIDSPTLKQDLEELGVQHVHYGVLDRHYASVREALFQMLDHVLLGVFREEEQAAWAWFYAELTDPMIVAAKGTSLPEIVQSSWKSLTPRELFVSSFFISLMEHDVSYQIIFESVDLTSHKHSFEHVLTAAVAHADNLAEIRGSLIALGELHFINSVRPKAFEDFASVFLLTLKRFGVHEAEVEAWSWFIQRMFGLVMEGNSYQQERHRNTTLRDLSDQLELVTRQHTTLFLSRLHKVNPSAHAVVTEKVNSKTNYATLFYMAMKKVEKLPTMKPILRATTRVWGMKGVQPEHYYAFEVSLIWSLHQVLHTEGQMTRDEVDAVQALCLSINEAIFGVDEWKSIRAAAAAAHNIAIIDASWVQIASSPVASEAFGMTFYAKFVKTMPSVSRMFVEMNVKEQANKFVFALTGIIHRLNDLPKLERLLHVLSLFHAQMEIRSKHVRVFIVTFLEVVESTFGSLVFHGELKEAYTWLMEVVVKPHLFEHAEHHKSSIEDVEEMNAFKRELMFSSSHAHAPEKHVGAIQAAWVRLSKEDKEEIVTEYLHALANRYASVARVLLSSLTLQGSIWIHNLDMMVQKLAHASITKAMLHRAAFQCQKRDVTGDVILYGEPAFSRIIARVLARIGHAEALPSFTWLYTYVGSSMFPDCGLEVEYGISTLGFRSVVELVSVRKESPDISSFVFRSLQMPNQTDGSAHAGGRFFFHPGQFARVEVDGGLRRSYTISSFLPPAQFHEGSPTLQLTVKREPKGAVSRILHDELRVGSRVDLVTIGGEFTVPLTPGGDIPSKILFISGGVGITPVWAQLASVLSRPANHDVVFLHSAKSKEHVIWPKEMSQIQAEYPWTEPRLESKPRVDVIITLTKDQDNEYRSGRIDLALLQSIAEEKQWPWDDVHVFMCAPIAFLKGVSILLKEAGLPPSHLHTELFV